MRRILFAILAIAALVVGGQLLARHDEPTKGKRSVKVLSAPDIVEKLGGKSARATTVELTIPAGEAGAPHRHPGPVFGYILEGEYEWAIDDKPSKILKVGDTFYEPTGALHRVSKNPSAKGVTRVLAILIHPRDVKALVIPEKPTKGK